MPINYPKGAGQTTPPTASTQQSFARRGMGLEDAINRANDFYQAHNLAVIHKKPTPITIVKVNYPKRSAARITEAYFQQASTTDYNGVYQGRYLDFDAKETRNKTTFPLKNFHPHQVAHLARITAQNGLGFVIIRFTVRNENFVYPATALIQEWQRCDGKRSISYDTIVESGFPIPSRLTIGLDYLSAIDDWLATLP